MVSGPGSISGTRRASTAQHTESGATDTGICSTGTCCMGFWIVVHCGLLGSVLWCAARCPPRTDAAAAQPASCCA